MKTFAEATIIGRIVRDAENIRKAEEEPLYKIQLAHTIDGLADGVQNTFWYSAFVRSQKLADALKKGTAVMIRGQLVPSMYESKISYSIRSAAITLLEPPAPTKEKEAS